MADQISDLHKCIFIHVPKAGGSSIEQSSIFHDQRNETNEYVGGHKTALEYKRVYPDKFDKYFKFTLVRNPYSRLVSAYFYLSRGGGRGNSYDTEIFKKHFEHREKDFVSFCRNSLSEELIEDVVHFQPQYKFLCDDNMNILVDFIGRQENFVKDAQKIFEKIGLPYEHRHSLGSNNKHFSEYYTSDIQEKVFNLYKLDFELLGYQSDIRKQSKFLYQCNKQMSKTVALSSRFSKKVKKLLTNHTT